MHGLPGNERNLDLAQAIRRAGWDVLTFTYRGAWGSPGDFSIANSMEDTAAALAFARSPDGAKFGIDPRHIVLAGHSMGGATAFMTAASATGPRRPDPDRRLEHRRQKRASGADTREALAKGFDDFGNSLHGATPESVADEVVAKRAQWNLVAAGAAPCQPAGPDGHCELRHWRGKPPRPRPRCRQAGNRQVTAIEMDTDHSFSDHRMALAAAVVGWLQALAAQALAAERRHQRTSSSTTTPRRCRRASRARRCRGAARGSPGRPRSAPPNSDSREQ